MTSKTRRLPDWLNDIREAIHNIRADIGELNKAEFESSGKTIRAVTKSIESIGEAANQIIQIAPDIQLYSPASWLHLKRVYAMRNVLSHGYFRTDAGVVWDTVQI